MKQTLLIVIILYTWCHSFAQTKTIDSLKEALNNYKKEDTVKIKMLIKYGYSISNYNMDAALAAMKQSLKLATQLKQHKFIALANLRVADGYMAESKYDSAIAAALDGLQTCELYHVKNISINLYGDLDESYRLMGNNKQAEYYANLFLDSAKASNDTLQQLNALIQLDNLYDQRKNWEKEKLIAQQLLPLAIKHKDEGKIAGVYENEGERFEAVGNLYEAKTNFINSLLLFKKLNFVWEVAYIQADLSSVYLKLKNKDSAAYYAYASLTTARVNKLKGETADAYEALFNYHHTFKDYKAALEDKMILDSLHNELNNANMGQTVQQAEMKYRQEKKDLLASIEQAKKDAETKQIKNQQLLTILTLGFIVAAVIIIALIQFRNNKQKQKANTLLQQEKEKVENTLAELKSTQAQLIQSEKMASLGELTAGIAHEIQNPLNFVNNFSELNKELLEELKEEADKGNLEDVKTIASDVIENEAKINHHGKRADAIVKGMLQHSRKNNGVKENIDINALCDEYLRLSYHGFRAKDKNFNADCKTHFDESIGKINIVPQDMGRVLLNLFNNAFYAVNEKKKTADENYQPLVTVATKRSLSTRGEGWGEVEIIVKDNGKGISQSIIDKIFQPFFTTKPTGEGTGLGLSLSYDIITKEHNGTIKVESEEEQGSTFRIALPS